MLPAPALSTITEAVALDELSEKMDGAMAKRLGETFTEDDYIAAYRAATARVDRERQLGTRGIGRHVTVRSSGCPACRQYARSP